MATKPGSRTLNALRQLRLSIMLLIAVVAVGTVGFVVLGKRPLAEALYMTLVTVSTLGMKPQSAPDISAGEMIWIMVMIAGGVSLAMVALSTIIGMVVEGQVRGIFGRRQVDRTIASLSGHIIVCGYGRMGHSLCQYLQQRHAAFVIVDHNPDCTSQAEQEQIPYVLGDATSADVLKNAGIERARGLVTVLHSDGDNVLVSLVARELNSKLHICARADRSESEEHLMRAGADIAICPQIIGARRLANILTRPSVVDFIDFATEGLNLEAEQYRLAEENELVGKTLRQANLPSRFGILVIALKRADGQITFNPSADTLLQIEDVMILTGQPGSMAKLQQFYA